MAKETKASAMKKKHGRIFNRPAPDWQNQKLILAQKIVKELKAIRKLLEEGKPVL
jgi:hypothetical protein